MVKVSVLEVGMILTNCYIVFDDEVKEALVTDPGGDAERIKRAVEKLGVKPVAILLTHAHGDHIFALSEIRDAYDIPVYVHEDDEKMLADGRLNLMGVDVRLKDKDVRLKGGEELHLGGMDIKVIHTPGHTPGGVCYYFEEAGILLAGDTLFWHSWGRTDFPGGSERTLMSSIREKLLPLPPETLVLPGHERETTIGAERKVHGYRG